MIKPMKLWTHACIFKAPIWTYISSDPGGGGGGGGGHLVQYVNGYVPRWRPPFSSLQSRSLGTTFTHRCRSSDFIACYPLPRYWFLSVLGNPPMYRSLALTHGRSRLRSLCERAVAVTLAGPRLIDSTSRHHPEPAPPTAVHVGGRGLVYVREAIVGRP